MRPITLAYCLLLVPGAIAQRAPFTYEDLIMLDRLSGLQVNSTGTHAVFAVRSTDLAKNRGTRSIWMKDLMDAGAPAVKLDISAQGAANVQWSADSKALYFLSGDGSAGTMNLWRCDGAGRNAQPLTHLPLDIEAYRITPDGKGAVVALAVFPDCGGNEIDCTVDRQAAKRTGSGMVYDRLFVRHWDTWADGTRLHLFRIDFDNGRVTALTPGFDGDVPSKPFGDEGDFIISPDGRTVWFSARVAGKTEPWSTNFDLWSVPMGGGALTNHTASNPAWDAAPRLSPDGRTVAFKAMRRPGFEADRFALRLLDAATGRITPLAEAWDRSVDQLAWSRDGKSLLVTADEMGRHKLFRIDARSGAVTPLSSGGHIDDFAETPRGFAYLKSGLDSPSVLYASAPKAKQIDDGAMQLTQFNPQLREKRFGAFEQFSFKGWNDEQVHGYVVKPADFVEGRKYPVAFLIHGGPQGSFGEIWTYRWNAMSFAGAGYAVVMIDFHGSTGYGQAFCDAISQHWGDRPLEDLQKGWAHALKAYPFLDGDRAAALGASYGGYMVNWIASQWPEPWKALVSHCGVFDTRSMGYSTEELWFTDWENGGSAFTHPERHDTFNPALHADEWRVPMLIVHGDLDYRIPVTQGIAAFTALQERGVPSRLLRFPDENHWVLKPQNSRQWYGNVLGWLDQWTGRGK
jgi:acylaminoacyl-peptidase